MIGKKQFDFISVWLELRLGFDYFENYSNLMLPMYHFISFISFHFHLFQQGKYIQ